MTKRYAARTLRHTLGVFLLGLVLTTGASAQDATFDSVETGDLTVNGEVLIESSSDIDVQSSGDIDLHSEDHVDITGISGAHIFSEDHVVIESDDSASVEALGVNIYGDEYLQMGADMFAVLYADLFEICGQEISIDGDTFFEDGIVSLGTLRGSGNELLYLGGRVDPTRIPVNDPYIPPRIVIEDQTSQVKIREMFSLINNGGSMFSFTDTNIDSTWFFSSNRIGGFNVSLSGTGGPELAVTKTGRVTMGPGGVKNFDLRPNGNLHILGTLFQSSDRNLKEEFADVEPESVLGKIDQLPVTTWQFKANEAGNRHMGPTAQDFYAAFGLGKDEKTIAPVDGVGVSLAGIKALSAQGKQKDAEIQELSQELKSQKELLQSQKELIENQQQLLKRLSSRLSALESKSQANTVGLVGSAVVAK